MCVPPTSSLLIIWCLKHTWPWPCHSPRSFNCTIPLTQRTLIFITRRILILWASKVLLHTMPIYGFACEVTFQYTYKVYHCPVYLFSIRIFSCQVDSRGHQLRRLCLFAVCFVSGRSRHMNLITLYLTKLPIKVFTCCFAWICILSKLSVIQKTSWLPLLLVLTPHFSQDFSILI